VTDQTLAMIDDATQRLIRAVGSLTDEQIAEASLLPGWTRGHVLTHVARNADALRNLLIWARTGVETPAYASQQARDADIEAGASRTAAELAADVSRSAEAFSAQAEDFPASARLAMVSVLGAEDFPAELVLTRRLVEVELHYTDLGCGYRRANWPSAFATLDLPDPMHTFRSTR
jgi:maleylpyruvate isomerase